MKLSVNILSWNNKDVMQYSLPMLREELNGIRHEVVFVDNGSIDGTKDLILRWELDNPMTTTCFFNKENRGISIGKNQGIDASVGDYVFMFDGDVLPVPNSIRLMMKWLDENQDKHAIGMYPNKFSLDMNKGHLSPCESFCNVLFNPVVHNCTCLFYGMFRRKLFDDGLRMDESGEYGKPGYGWEDHDFYKRMRAMGVDQYVTHINHPRGRYYHKINSSIRVMGDDAYRETMTLRSKQFKETWDVAG